MCAVRVLISGSLMLLYCALAGRQVRLRALQMAQQGAIGVLLLANFGEAGQLTIAGRRVGLRIVPPRGEEASRPESAGSCMIILATDAPVSDRQLTRLARRAQNGLARTGNLGAHMSGEYVIAFTNNRRLSHWPTTERLASTELAEDGRVIDLLFQAVVEATEEAVINALFTANTVVGRLRHVRYLCDIRLLNPHWLCRTA